MVYPQILWELESDFLVFSFASLFSASDVASVVVCWYLLLLFSDFGGAVVEEEDVVCGDGGFLLINFLSSFSSSDIICSVFLPISLGSVLSRKLAFSVLYGLDSSSFSFFLVSGLCNISLTLSENLDEVRMVVVMVCHYQILL